MSIEQTDSPDAEFLRDLSNFVDGQAVYRTVELALKEKGFRDTTGKLKPIVETALTIKALGHRPTFILVILDYVSQCKQPVTRADIANYLEKLFGKGYLRGGPNIELGRVLDTLEKLGIIQSINVKIGKQSRSVKLFKSINLQVTSASLKWLVRGLPAEDTIDVTTALKKRYDERVAGMKDYDGKLVDFDASKIVESIIRSGGSFQESILTLNRILPQLETGIEKAELQRLVYGALSLIDKHAAEDYKQNYPIKLYIKTPNNEEKPITYTNLSEELVLTYLKKLGNVCYMSKGSKMKIAEFVYSSLYVHPDQATGSVISEKTMCEMMELGFFKLYGKGIIDYLEEAGSHKKTASLYLRHCQNLWESQRRLSREETIQKMAKLSANVIDANARFALYVLLSNRIVPPPPRSRMEPVYQVLVTDFLDTLLFGKKVKEAKDARDTLRAKLGLSVPGKDKQLREHFRRIRDLAKATRDNSKEIKTDELRVAMEFLRAQLACQETNQVV